MTLSMPWHWTEQYAASSGSRRGIPGEKWRDVGALSGIYDNSQCYMFDFFLAFVPVQVRGTAAMLCVVQRAVYLSSLLWIAELLTSIMLTWTLRLYCGTVWSRRYNTTRLRFACGWMVYIYNKLNMLRLGWSEVVTAKPGLLRWTIFLVPGERRFRTPRTKSNGGLLITRWTNTASSAFFNWLLIKSFCICILSTSVCL